MTSALEAETGEPVAWIDPRDLAVLACPGVKEFGAMRYAGVSGAQNSKSTTPLYTAPPPAAPDIGILKEVTEALAARLGTNADEWPLVMAARAIVEDAS